MASAKCLDFTKAVWRSFIDHGGLDAKVLANMSVISATPGKLKCQMQIEKHHVNRYNTLHGGTIATMVDLGGTLAVATRGLWTTGVSTDINITYISSGGTIGDTITMEGEVVRLGKTLAFTSVFFRNAKGEMFAKGNHTKFVAKCWTDERNKVEELHAVDEPAGKTVV